MTKRREERFPVEEFYGGERHRLVYDQLVEKIALNGSVRFDSDTLCFPEVDDTVRWLAFCVMKMENELRERISERLVEESNSGDWAGQVSPGFAATMLQIVTETE